MQPAARTLGRHAARRARSLCHGGAPQAASAPAMTHATLIRHHQTPTQLFHTTTWTHHSDVQQAQRSADNQQAPGTPTPTDNQHQPNDLDDMLHNASSIQDALHIIQERGSQFTDCNCVTAATRLATLHENSRNDTANTLPLVQHPQFIALIDMVMAAAATFSPHEITQLVGAFGTLHCEDQDLLDSLARELIDRVDAMELEALQELVSGLAKADHSPSVALFDVVRARAKVLGGENDQNLAASFAALGYQL